MATVTSQDVICRIIEDGTLELETKAGCKPEYNGVVVMKDMLLVTDLDECNIQLYNRHDGKLITSHRLESNPWDVCLIYESNVAFCLVNGTIVIMSFKSIDDVKLVKTLTTGIFPCYSLAKLNSDNLVVSGFKDGILCWGILSITDGRIDSIHDICKGNMTHTAIKDNTLYISCSTYDSITNGVYAYDILNSHTHKFLYQHQELKLPGSIMVDRDCVYVCDKHSNRIHQLTESGQPVTIHTASSRLFGIFYDDQHKLLYTTSTRSNVITIYKMDSLHQSGVPIEILKMDDRSIQLFKEALKDGKETVHSIRIMVVGHMGVGKTTLVKRLLGEEVNISERHTTEGIDVYVNCCDVSLSTHEWMRRKKHSEQDYKLQRLVMVINENYQTVGTEVNLEHDSSSIQMETTDGNNAEVLYRRSQQHNIDQNISSTTSLQNESSSTVVQGSLNQSETNTIHGSELRENVATETIDALGDMLKLLQQNPNAAKQHISKHAILTILDFAGQYAFYTTHQMFLTRRAIYLLVLDASQEVEHLVKDDFYFDTEGRLECKVHDLVQVWMNSIHSCGALPDEENLNSSNSHMSFCKVLPPPVLLVGTHIDQIPQDDRRECGQKYLKTIRSYISDKPTAVHLVDEVFAIDNSVIDSTLDELKKKIVEVASQQPYWGERIPTRWYLLEQQLITLRDAGIKVVSHSTVETLNNKADVRIEKSEELDLFLRYLHETGTVIYFSIEALRDNILLDPKWMIDALKILMYAQPHLPNNPVDNDTASDAHSEITQTWSDFKEKGKLTVELVDAIWTTENHPELHEHKEHILRIMEQLNILARPRSFNEMGEKVEDYFLTPCMLRQESPKEVISPEKDPRMVRTPDMRCIFTEKYLPTPIFHRLLAACVARWPVAKKKETSESLFFCGCGVFDLDLYHRLTVYIKNHVVFANITRMVVDEVKTPDAKLCSRVRRFITRNLSEITSYLGQNLQLELHAAYQTWLANESHEPDAPITREHMNHARLCIAIVTVCGNAMRDILSTQVHSPHTGNPGK